MSRIAQPHIREFLADTLTPLGVYARLAALSPTRFLLESVTGGDTVSRYSFIGAAPWGVYRLFPDRLELEREGEIELLEGAPLATLERELAAIHSSTGSLPLMGGYVGYLAYDFVRLLENLPSRPPKPDDLPLAVLARFDSLVIFDHAHQKVMAIANEVDGMVSRSQAESKLGVLSELLTEAGHGSAVQVPGASGQTPVAANPSMSGEDFQNAVRAAKEHIAAGDIFQVVLARRWHVESDIEPLALYRALRTVNPSPYMVLLEMPDVALVGASPEMLVRKTGSRLETRPIAGTRPRAADPEEDRALANELLADEKERAEHVMLVDLGRNDLGRVAAPGSVRLPSFMEIERYSHVMHIVTSVEAQIASGSGAFDALKACFPAGTVSGAPKIRAMEIIHELEPESRGPYAGAVGYISYSGDLDTCITIRTMVIRPGEVSMTAGAGIVADSDPRSEEKETENKAAATLSAIHLASRISGADIT